MTRTVTALEKRRGGRVLVELDGVAWRELPLEVVVQTGLTVGARLDRGRAREVARARRAHRAATIALTALGRREHTAASIRARLRRRRVGASTTESTVRALEESGSLSDERYAEQRVRTLVERGYGNAYIEHALQSAGLAPEPIADALARAQPERERVAAIVARRGAGVGTARYLCARGFGEDEVEEIVAFPADGGIR